ncbi:MAG: acetate kinase [Corynebacterium sp.]|nr:acetate kinase [Corynebacterium sp.]
MSYVLVLNSGSSSIKFQILNPKHHATDTPFVAGLVEQIGEEQGKVTIKVNGEKTEREAHIANHEAGLDLAFTLMDELDAGPNSVEIIAVGHRVVHGGVLFSEPVLVEGDVLTMIRRLIPLAPLHNPANVKGIEVARRMLPEVPHVAVFDTGFFHNMPASASTYAIDFDSAQKYGIRRYGFHGTSHEYVSQKVHQLLDADPGSVNQITLHLGNGASCAAIRGGVAVDTSMGMTPLAGLVMGTRTGDIDPGIIFHLHRQEGLSIDEIDEMFNKRSGVKGIAGVNDFRELRKLIEQENRQAFLAYSVYIKQLRRYIGAYMAELGRVDAITFTAGVGENDPYVRADALANMQGFGIKLNPEANHARSDEPRLISAPESKVKVFVVPTNEELAIARYASTFAYWRD